MVSLTLSWCTSYALKLVDSFHKATGITKAVFPVMGGLTVGLIALAYPEVLYWGFENVDILLESRPFVNSLPASILIQLVGVKIIATSLSRASGLVGGYYAPSLFIGAATGMAYGKLMRSAFAGPHALFHFSILEVASPQAYGLVTFLCEASFIYVNDTLLVKICLLLFFVLQLHVFFFCTVLSLIFVLLTA